MEISKKIRLRKGLNIRLKGSADKVFIRHERTGLYAIKPTDFHGIMPKMVVKPGDSVLVGSPLFFDKHRPDIFFTSPVAGSVSEIRRGERRIIEEIIIKANNEDQFIDFGQADPQQLSREQIIEKLLNSGLWPLIRQRPYGIISNPADRPKSIFISAFNTAPLSPDIDFVVTGEETAFQAGIDALSKLTSGKIHLNINGTYPPSPVFSKAKGVQVNTFTGPHPSGNVGIQIHHIDPVNKGDIVWYLYPQDVISIGRLFQKGVYDALRIVALTGPEVIKPRYYKTTIGSNIKPLINNNIQSKNVRFISGDALTGKKIEADGFIGFYDSQITVIPEGNYFEMFGWALPGINKFSISRTFLSWLQPDRKYYLDTNLHGGKRALVLTGLYEKVLPMNIYPMHLLKAIMVNDIDKMEQLGIYEIIEEDFALCEYVCPSKTEIQTIIREGLDNIRREMH